MNRLSERKTKLRFVTDAEVRYRGKLRPVVIEVTDGFTGNVRLGRTRLRYPFSWQSLFHNAAERYAWQKREERRLAREASQKGKSMMAGTVRTDTVGLGSNPAGQARRSVASSGGSRRGMTRRTK